MRLLNVDTLKLKEFQGKPPEYAVLSHTWGSDEVTFEDMSFVDWPQKAGWEKILDCCKLCKQQGWEWVWIDTCCIDKSSSAELSEAINSMFTWYQQASICYAYLCDVVPDPMQSRAELFKAAKWHTRGWCLQEMLAPRSLIFLDEDWNEIGSRSSMSREVEEITGISPLDVAHFRSCSIAKRMSWASKRQTTRVEDQAYCLLGLFDINMPLLYGEGAKAFARLQHEIIKSSDDESIFAWRGAYRPRLLSYSGMIAPSARCFAGMGSIEAFTSDEHRSEFAMTNKGLSINFRTWLYVGKEGLYRATDQLVPLNCKFRDQEEPIAIHLTHEGGESYVRTQCYALEQWGLHFSKSPQWTAMAEHRIYIRQVEENLDLPDHREDALRFVFRRAEGLVIRSISEYRDGDQYSAANVLHVADAMRDVLYDISCAIHFQLLVVIEVYATNATAELFTLCISSFNDFVALRMFNTKEYESSIDMLEEAQRDLKRATDTAMVNLPKHALTIKAHARPTSRQSIGVHTLQPVRALQVALTLSASDDLASPNDRKISAAKSLTDKLNSSDTSSNNSKSNEASTLWFPPPPTAENSAVPSPTKLQHPPEYDNPAICIEGQSSASSGSEDTSDLQVRPNNTRFAVSGPSPYHKSPLDGGSAERSQQRTPYVRTHISRHQLGNPREYPLSIKNFKSPQPANIEYSHRLPNMD